MQKDAQGLPECLSVTFLQVKPRRGDALLFWSVHFNGTIDAHALHGGCPVVQVSHGGLMSG